MSEKRKKGKDRQRKKMCVNVCTTQISAFTRSVESLSVRQINNNNKKNVNVSSTLLHAELQNSTGHEKKRNMATLTHVYLLLYYRRVTFFFFGFSVITVRKEHPEDE